MERERLLALVRARVQRFAASGDPGTVLAPEAVPELTALLAAVPDPAADFEVAYAAGWLRWDRYLVLDPYGDGDLGAALTLFLPVYRERPDAVPADVRIHFGRLDASAEPLAVAQRGFVLFREALGTGD
jgi:hypothetical protein